MVVVKHQSHVSGREVYDDELNNDVVDQPVQLGDPPRV
jgi:hypothetical protein